MWKFVVNGKRRKRHAADYELKNKRRHLKTFVTIILSSVARAFRTNTNNAGFLLCQSSPEITTRLSCDLELTNIAFFNDFWLRILSYGFPFPACEML